jgi:hypothetical protein
MNEFVLFCDVPSKLSNQAIFKELGIILGRRKNQRESEGIGGCDMALSECHRPKVPYVRSHQTFLPRYNPQVKTLIGKQHSLPTVKHR